MWIDKRDDLPKLNKYGESDEVLCICRKYGFHQDRVDTDRHELLFWDGKVWQGWGVDDYERNADYLEVVYWMEIPILDKPINEDNLLKIGL